MKLIYQVFIVLYFAFSYVACSEVKFSDIPDERCTNSPECTETNGELTWNYTQTIGSVDILFVDDNSGSMFEEQRSMADRFNNFISKLDADNINYQIAVTTTDVSATPGNIPAAPNGYGTFQDGKFLKTDGKDIIKSSSGTSSERIDWFKRTIQRQETLDCESLPNNYSQSGCPSVDERGIYAVNLALDRADTRFFRKDSHLAIVILSDEDERGNGADLEEYDLPETLVSKVHNQFQSRKTLSVHTLIIQPEDVDCKNDQTFIVGTFGLIIGRYGEQYARLQRADDTLRAYGNIQKGVEGSICSSDYGAKLSQIGDVVADNTFDIQLACSPKKIDVSISPDPGPSVSYAVDDSNLLTFTGSLNSGSVVDLDYTCDKI